MKTTPLFLRFAQMLLFALCLLGPATEKAHASAVATQVSQQPSGRLHANKLFDYIRGNRSRMVQVATIALGIGLVILMTSTRKH